ncbi:DUF2254 domain-containing protein [Myxococcus sp. K15C18031901]|uniref:DUF2254 domain-containing protein n=1 Tax=Myxococcus dinghuensis TaxID=2906761 RepID=UPI0020A7EA15|nr:DUF2254 domain-containing protein [Myxococcus dinghuensis]MCP3099871.1 DUF2254 domain-containing protein [Myxococcus dinghuensis]
MWLPAVLGAVVGTALALLLVKPPRPIAGVLSGVAWQTTTSEARQMLSTTLGIALSSLSIVLSLSMLVAQNAAAQYSPRLLRMYLHSAGSRVVLPVFVATSVFCLVAAHAFGLSPENVREPRPALALAMLLLVACEAALIFQVLHTLQRMRVENLVQRVRHATLDVARRLTSVPAETLESSPPRSASTPSPLRIRRSGFVVAVDTRALLTLATERRLVIHLERAIGEPVVRGEDVGWLEYEPPASDASPESTERHVLHAIRVDRWRDEDQDITLGIRQLVDVAIKALSPGINDPYTAVEAVDQLTLLLCELGQLPLGSRVLTDASGTPRVFLRGPTLRDCLELATDQILRYGKGEPAVVLHLLRLAACVAQRARQVEDRRAARARLHTLLDTTEPTAPWQPLLRRYADALERALDGGAWPALPAIGF